MTKVLINGTERTYDGYIVESMSAVKQLVQKDWDGLLFVFGREGVGKSTFALQLALFLDHSFSIEKIAWTPEQFIEKVKNAKRHDCIVLDEAFLTFTKRSSISALQNTIITLLTMIRSRNLFIIVVCPVIFDMKPYLVVHRALAAFRCYHHGLERGYWGLYDEEAKAKLYYKGIRDGYNVHAVKPVYYGRFLSWLPVDKAEYEERKQAAINQLLDRQPKDEPTPETVKKQLESELRAVNFFRRNHWLKAGALKAFYTNKNISERYFYELLTAQGLPPKGSDLQTGDSSSLTFERSAEDSPKEPPKSFKQRLDGDDVGGWPHGDY